MKYVHFLFALGAIAAASTATAANRPSGWTTICKEGQTCTVAASTTVAFGRADQFLYKVLSGSFSCSQTTFGGKIAGGVNECSTGPGTAPPPPPPPPPPPAQRGERG